MTCFTHGPFDSNKFNKCPCCKNIQQGLAMTPTTRACHEEQEAELAALRELEQAASIMVSICKQRGLIVEYVMEGGLAGREQTELMKISLLDRLAQALASLDALRSGHGNR